MTEKLIHLSGMTDDIRLLDWAVLFAGTTSLALGILAAFTV